MTSAPEITVFIDNQCRVCRREVAWLRKLDRHNRIRFTDISAPDFEPPTPGHSYEVLMAEIHGLTVEGEWLIGVEVFRRMYAACGFGIVVWPTRLPGISNAMDWGYRIFARNRVKWFGPCDDGCTLPSADIATAGESR